MGSREVILMTYLPLLCRLTAKRKEVSKLVRSMPALRKASLEAN